MANPFRLQLPGPILEEMLTQARAEFPNECCGVLAGTVFESTPTAPNDSTAIDNAVPTALVVCRYALVNAANSPVEYLSDPKSMFEADRDMRRRGLTMLAVYHSHPTSPAIPSKTDLARNYSPQVMNFIVSLETTNPNIRGWWLSETEFREAQWELIPVPDASAHANTPETP